MAHKKLSNDDQDLSYDEAAGALNLPLKLYLFLTPIFVKLFHHE